MSDRHTLTHLLRRWSAGEAAAFDALMDAAYPRLHRMARRHAARERAGHTLEATGLLHEALLRLMDVDGLSWRDRGHFYATTARMMRRILVDYAREQKRQKRGGDAVKVTLSEASCLPRDGGTSPDLEALDDALTRLEAHDPRKARLVELRFFAGLTGAEIARSISFNTGPVCSCWRRKRRFRASGC
jgi:RNA polymerase sigma factor (TIGR02999 family)